MDKARILVVDDTPNNLEILAEILSPEHHVCVADNGMDALRLARSEDQPDLILLDIQMPVLDGYHVCKALKEDERTRRIPVIFVTAMSEMEHEERGLRLGAVDYITKPLAPSIVLARVRTHLALYNQTRLLQSLVRERTAELEQARDEARAANQAKSAFLANMNHELRTPLNGIMGMTQLLMNGNPSGEQRDFLKDSWESCSRLLALVNDMLELSRAESGRIVLCPGCVNLEQGLAPILAHYRKRTAERGLTFRYRHENDIPACLTMDIGRIRQVLINLLNNALQFTSEGGITLSVSCEGANRGDDLDLTFSVSDTGPGIAAHQRDDLFDMFSIGEHYMTKKHSGAGLGLSISKRLVDLMNGNIWIAEDTDGTTFRFTVPCPRCDEDLVGE